MGAAELIGICVTTLNRPHVLAATLTAIRDHTPSDILVVVVDDGSSPPAVIPSGVCLIRHDRTRGIPAAKNSGLAALHSLGVEHFLLLDDDTRPCADGWYLPYVEGAEPHYQYSWTHNSRKRPVEKMSVIYSDPTLIGYTWSMGCLMYVTREVLDRVGGVNPAFGAGMEEHAEWSQRIHNAGFTTFVHQDHPDVSRRVWAADQHGAVTRSIPLQQRQALHQRNTALREALVDSTDYVPFGVGPPSTPECPAPDRDVVITSYFTGHPDPQRPGKRLPVTPKLITPLLGSLPSAAAVILHDTTIGFSVENHRVPAPLPAYQQRWISEYRYLRDHPEIRYAWLVDATDVQLLKPDVFSLMKPGVLYCGWEDQKVGCPWIVKHSGPYRPWVNAHAADYPLLNTGVVGGDRDTMLQLTRRMVDLWAAHPNQHPLTEMTLFQMAVTDGPFDVVTGLDVTTRFKAYETDNTTSMFRHK